MRLEFSHCQPLYIQGVSGGIVNTVLVRIMLTLLRTAVSSIPLEMCVRALNGTVARWLLCVKHDGEQVETVL